MTRASASARSANGQALGKSETVSFRTTDAAPTISMESGYFVAELERPVLPLWARNVSELEVTALRVTPGQFFLQ